MDFTADFEYNATLKVFAENVGAPARSSTLRGRRSLIGSSLTSTWAPPGTPWDAPLSHSVLRQLRTFGRCGCRTSPVDAFLSQMKLIEADELDDAYRLVVDLKKLANDVESGGQTQPLERALTSAEETLKRHLPLEQFPKKDVAEVRSRVSGIWQVLKDYGGLPDQFGLDSTPGPGP